MANFRSTNIESPEPDLGAQFAPSFIHNVLLTDKDEFSSLPSPESILTMSIHEFQDCLNESTLDHLDRSMVFKKAVRDHICESLAQHPEDMTPLHGLLLELHQQLRALIPKRKDLHSMLEDEQVINSHTLPSLKPFIIKAAKSLLQLESESRAGTTLELIAQLENENPSENSHQFWSTVIVYLIYKAELCQADKEKVYLVHVWVPRIHKEGPDLERKWFQERFGPFDKPESFPITRLWMKGLLLESQQKRLGGANPQGHESDGENSHGDCDITANFAESTESRKQFLRKCWIEDIVFRDPNKSNVIMPEIFAQDITGLQSIREATRLSVAGCALALHARTAAGITTQKEASDSRKTEVLKAMKMRHVPPNVYEDGVAKEVVALAEEWSPTGVVDLESLRGRVIAVLRGEDPVLQLLNNRIKIAVRDVVLQKLHHGNLKEAPAVLRTGIARGYSPNRNANNQSTAERLLCKRGLAFFASELAVVAYRAGKIVDLAIDLYWDAFLDKLVLELSEEAAAFSLD